MFNQPNQRNLKRNLMRGGLALIAVASLGASYGIGVSNASPGNAPTTSATSPSSNPSASSTSPSSVPSVITATATVTYDPNDPNAGEPEMPQFMWVSDAELGVTVLCAITSGGLSCDWANAEITEGQP